jgi:hypothetical protein
MRRPTFKTITVPIRYAERLDGFPNAGPRPSVLGMKNLYWGMDAFCVRCGPYVYNVPQRVYLDLGGVLA